MSLPEWSPAAAAAMALAEEEACRRGHQVVGSEHLLWAMLSAIVNPGDKDWPRAITWVAGRVGMTEVELAQQLIQELEDRPFFKNRPVSNDQQLDKLPHAEGLTRTLQVVAQFANRTVVDESLGLQHDGGLVATEFLLAGFLVEGTCLASTILAQACGGRVNSKSLLEAINVDPQSLRSPPLSVMPMTLSPPSGPSPPPLDADQVAEFKTLPQIESLPEGPTYSSNWLLPGSLLIGAKPSVKDMPALLKAGVTTFVCLIGEYADLNDYASDYPRRSAKYFKHSTDFVWFPIMDFDVVDAKPLTDVVMELRRRITAGHTVFVHCRGGHGRTGLVVVPLVSALYNIGLDEARQFVLTATKLGRGSDRGCRWHIDMPETDEQVQRAEEICPYVRGMKRTGRDGAL